MLALLSPAKKLTEGPAISDRAWTAPALLDAIPPVLDVARALSIADLRALMKLSEALGTLNFERFQRFSLAHTPENARQACLTFAGDVYQGWGADTLGADDLSWAQDHVAILSGLYGLLRPLDLVQPYRLEMGTRLANPAGPTLYHHWRPLVTARIDALLQGHAHRVVVNLASNEYFKAVDKEALKAPVIEVAFKELEPDGRARVISFYAKRARGMMARMIVEHRLTSPESLRAFDVAGYRFDAPRSTDTHLTFTRPRP